MLEENKSAASMIPSSVGQAACGIVHDLSNLIQTIILRAEVTAATEPVSAACIKRMEQIVDDGQGGANIVRSLLEYARKSIDAMTPIEAGAPVKAAAVEVGALLGIEIRMEIEERPCLARLDPLQLRDLLYLVFYELSKDAAPDARYALSLKHAKPEGEALSWMAEELWLEIKMTRIGQGSQLELEEGNLFKSGHTVPTGEHVMNLLRIRGIVRQHKGQVRVIEEVDDARQTESVEAFFPIIAC